ncbi:hypothetical protein [Ruegeria sp.]|uniref:hypothetical protein n=1 Tax=Ruegeria sp. TaxID=1879320 RepID=UPI003B009D8C
MRCSPGLLAAVLLIGTALQDGASACAQTPTSSPAGVSPQQSGRAAGQFSGPSHLDDKDVAALRQALERALIRLEADIAELRHLRDWQRRLIDAARSDPEGARKQRREHASCANTALAPYCARLTGTYRQEAEK